MLTARITLTWPDGLNAVANLAAESAERDYPVRYTGDLARLADAPATADFPFLSFALKSIAQQSGAAYAEEVTGQYDRHAV